MKHNTWVFFALIFILITSCVDKPKKESLWDADEASEKSLPTGLKAELLYEVKAQLGEGAFWNYKTQEFYWIDIEGKQLHIYNPKTKINRSFPTPSRIGTVVPQTAETSVVALEDGIYIMNTGTGALSVLSDVEKEMTINRFNDGKCDPNGNLWVGSMHLDQSAPMASVYKISAEGETTKMIDSVTISNGIVWNKSATKMYYIDTPTSEIRSYDYDKRNATISNRQTLVKIPVSDGFPDCMTIDENDNLWVGLWNGNAVANYDSRLGVLIQKIEVPAHNVTACAFGGPNLDILYITTASIDMTDEEKKEYPFAGSLFSVKLGVKGVESDLFGTNE